jgi:hypothetical protein
LPVASSAAHKTSATLERPAEGAPDVDPFALGVDVGKADVDVLGPERHQVDREERLSGV